MMTSSFHFPKSFLFILIAALLSFSQLVTAQLATSEGKPKVAVWDFTLEGLEGNEGRAITNRLRSELVNSRKFRVMTRDQIQTLLGEQALGETLINAKEAIKAGKLKGVKYVVTGTIISLRNAFQLTAEMIDGESAEIIQSITPKTYRGDFLDFLDIEVPKVAARLVGATGEEAVVAERIVPLPPPIQPTPIVKPPMQEPLPPQQEIKSNWMGSVGIISLAAAGVLQIIALANYGTATSDAEQAGQDNDSDLYQQSLDEREAAEGIQAVAILAGLVGTVFLVLDAMLPFGGPMGMHGPMSGQIPSPYQLEVKPQSVMASYNLRW